MTTKSITGRTAITVAEIFGVRLRKYADAIVPAIDDITANEARAICREDPSLVYVDSAEVAEAIGDDAIIALRREADGRDEEQVAICRRALDHGGDVTLHEYDLTAAQRARIVAMTRTEARAECARVIAEARAQAVRS